MTGDFDTFDLKKMTKNEILHYSHWCLGNVVSSMLFNRRIMAHGTLSYYLLEQKNELLMAENRGRTMRNTKNLTRKTAGFSGKKNPPAHKRLELHSIPI